MSTQNPGFGQTNIVKLSDEDATAAVLESAGGGSELASEVDFQIPHCVNTIEEAIALIRENRTAWLAAQRSK